jgi:alpha-D-ribose 1-methylphosphonate 5-triphosphate diphosphatase
MVIADNNNSGLVIENATVVTPERVLEGASVRIEGDRIAEISSHIKANGYRRIDAKGMHLLPGFVDLHSDAIEKEIEPRPSAYFPINMALFELDKKLAAAGITTMYHSISFGEQDYGVRANETASDIIKEINRLGSDLTVRTRVHARFEMTSAGAVSYIEDLIGAGYIHLLSLMDHTPGQGQFREVAAYRKYYRERYNIGDDQIDEIVERKKASGASVKTEYVERIVAMCREKGIPVASHDDDCEEKIEAILDLGVGMTEFPINLGTACAAKKRGILVCLGAPNIVRGGSQGKNLSARDAIKAGCGDLICSDYYPMCIVHAVAALYKGGLLDLPAAVNMATLNPAMAAGIAGQTGSIEVGKLADLVLVDMSGEVPRTAKTLVGGREVFSTWRS